LVIAATITANLKAGLTFIPEARLDNGIFTQLMKKNDAFNKFAL
jgi:hypothetical protein